MVIPMHAVPRNGNLVSVPLSQRTGDVIHVVHPFVPVQPCIPHLADAMGWSVKPSLNRRGKVLDRQTPSDPGKSAAIKQQDAVFHACGSYQLCGREVAHHVVDDPLFEIPTSEGTRVGQDSRLQTRDLLAT
jgi:hypothetical protein